MVPIDPVDIMENALVCWGVVKCTILQPFLLAERFFFFSNMYRNEAKGANLSHWIMENGQTETGERYTDRNRLEVDR